MKDIPDRVMRTRNRSVNNSSGLSAEVSPVKKVAQTNKVNKKSVVRGNVKNKHNNRRNNELNDENVNVDSKDYDNTDESSSTESDSDSQDSDMYTEVEDVADLMDNITSIFDTATKLDQIKSDQYFLSQSKRPKTSNNSFAELLDNFNLQDDEIEKIIKAQYEKFCKDFKIKPFNDAEYQKLYAFLTRDFNIILYGPGSKRELLNSFGEKYLSEHHYFSINGFMDNFKVRNFIEILNDTMNMKKPIYKEIELFAKMNEFYNGDDIVFLIHSIDLLFMKNPKMKDFLYNLFMNVSNIRIVATVDHINSALLWSLTEQKIFRWLWVQKDTHKSYTVERKFSSNRRTLFSTTSKAWQQSTNLHGITQVYNQVNRNSQQIFLMILKHYMTNKSTTYPFNTLYSDCREEFLVNSEVTLRQHLKEFEYHNLIRITKSSNGVESISVIIEKDTCQRFLSSIDES